MKTVFISNYFNHHQKPFSDAMDIKTDHNYTFIELERMEEERKSLGWGMNSVPEYVLNINDENMRDKCEKLINDADVVISGSIDSGLTDDRLRKNKLTFHCSERIYKKGYQWYKMPKRLVHFFFKFGIHKSLYLLCSSAYTSADYSRTLTYLGKAYKWGYFPETKKYESIEALIDEKKTNSILWVARFIDWKHPEIPLEIAKRLKDEGISFEINMIGNGDMLDEIRERVRSKGLSDSINVLGSMKPEEVRSYMEKSGIFMFTSDRNEGWGAVLNEAMNSGCAIVASHAIGSVPYMLEDKKNGLIYLDGDIDDLYLKVKKLLTDRTLCENLGREAYYTVCDHWNAENAAERLIALSEAFLAGDKRPSLFEKGICSRAEILYDNWYTK